MGSFGAGAVTYGYDAFNQLTSAGPTSGEGPVNDYAYDLAGNMLTDSSKLDLFFLLPIGTTSASYGPADEMTTYSTSRFFGRLGANGTTTPNYDLDGDLKSLNSPSAPTYSYDSQDRLVGITQGNQSTTLAYDGLGRLVQVVDQTGSAVTSSKVYAWCGQVRCAEYDTTPGGTLGSNPDKLYEPQGMVQMSPATITIRAVAIGPLGGFRGGPMPATTVGYYYVTDALGSVHVLVDKTGFVQSAYEYDSYGNQSVNGPVAGEQSDFGFAGLFEHAGLAFARDRAYSPSQARWLTRDPIGLSGGLNGYTYADNNPTSLSDPSGHLAGSSRDPAQDTMDWLNNGFGEYLFPSLTIMSAGFQQRANGIAEMASESTFEQGMHDYQCGSGNMALGAGVVSANAAILIGVAELPAGAGRGGSYRSVRSGGPGGQVHHMPSWGAQVRAGNSPFTYNSAPGIMMSIEDHMDTASWGTSLENQAYRGVQADLIANGQFLDALAMDINDIRANFGSKYDAEIAEMLNYLWSGEW